MILLAVLEFAILAFTFTLSKVAVSYSDPLFLIGIRMIFAAPIMFLVALFGSGFKKIERRHVKSFLAVGIVHIFLPFVGEFWALQYISSSKTAIIYSMTPFVAAILTFFLYKKKLSIKQVIALFLALGGLLPILLTPDQISHPLGEIFSISLPEIVLLASVVFASYAWFLIKKLMDEGYGISFINGVAMLIGGILSLTMWLIFFSHKNPLKGELIDFIFWCAALIIVANVISYNFYGWLLKKLSISMLSTIGFLCPVFASLYGFLLLDEKVGFNHLIALVFVSLGIYLFYQDEIKSLSRS